MTGRAPFLSKLTDEKRKHNRNETEREQEKNYTPKLISVYDSHIKNLNQREVWKHSTEREYRKKTTDFEGWIVNKKLPKLTE